ncbi:PREDICTED: cullin-1-like isoform X2 [Erythranthe guttata]|uniref:cullin-1-like isoform X2 n=1 Tax=Erythranthe guttata TaxID=4155 RepID=UPI00064DDA77|nr:PREDICTED: cullin-1-like isoform X2 [Erythranthe guttata]|eukprot:XP_012842209.1 PREDICTED: cullin-1-like isoform X2 [Erythranthe guttata]
MNNPRNTIQFDEGWNFVQKAITKLTNILEGLPEPQFTTQENMMIYETIYNMCTQKPPYDHTARLYEKYQESYVEYILTTVLPSLNEKNGELMLRELVIRWSNHKIMVDCLSKFFHYIDRYYVVRLYLIPCKEVGLLTFRDLVYYKIKGKVRDAVICLINREREGEQIDRVLLKNVLDFFVEIGMGEMDYYEDFEEAMINDAAAYYSQKASIWVLDSSCYDYMLKAHECFRQEKDRVSCYLHPSTETKLLKKVQQEFSSVVSGHSAQLLEKMHLEDSSDDMVCNIYSIMALLIYLEVNF